MRGDKILSEEETNRPLTDDEADALWGQYVESYDEAQRNFDSSLRTLAAGGIAVSATLAAAFGQKIDETVAVAVVLFLVSLLLNLVSYWSEQWDTGGRLKAVQRLDRSGAYGNRWQSVTAGCNYLAGFALLGAGGALAAFVLKTTS